ISPSERRIFTMSAGVRPTFSARSCALEPRTTLREGNAGLAGAAAGAGFAWAAGATAGTATVAVAAPSGRAAVALAGFGFTSGSGSALALGLARDLATGSSRAARGLAPGTALPPEARRRGTASSGTEDDA